jgi:valyl-tRNA synthetase
MELPKVYEPKEYESDIYALWEKSNSFAPKEKGKGEPFTIVMPPPNANGNLHIGHALTNAIQDIVIRYHRMKGQRTLYLPGADHAGFETWVVYEKQLNKEGKSRFDFSREELYSQVWDFVQDNKTNFENQLRALGASCDWTRFTFTLDDRVVDSSYKTFKKMWQDGLIYRGERIVNFCTSHGTSFSDIEVTHEEELTKLWHIAYPLADGSGEVVIATTRPETKLGQSALMVNPKDKRYQQMIGKIVNQPLVPDVPIKIIADDFVDMDFGTGVVTVTPGHDVNDFEVAERHNLPIIELITHEGKMSRHVPKAFRGLAVEEARPRVVAALKEAGALRKEEDYTHTVGKCYKCGTVIEPLVREQWFVSMEPLAKTAIKALKAGQINFYPEAKKKQLITYLQNIKDWNISRQIAWGIPIPAFQNVDDSEDWIFDTRVDQEVIVVDKKTYRRDPDVFDTWFSSGQWPFVTLGYPDQADFKDFYPLSLMETGFDIMNQWVARMIMLGLYITDKAPFKDVYLHGLVLDEHGTKMSKSKGNVVNPIDIVEKYGSDALRLGIITGQSAGNNQPFGEPKVLAGRNFCNKLWNISRYILSNLGPGFKYHPSPDPKSTADEWILAKLASAATQMEDLLQNYRLSEAYELLYHVVWDDFADWYIEASKGQGSSEMLAYLLDTILRLSHPFAPFVSETIWQTLPWAGDSLLIEQSWPQLKTGQKSTEFEEIIEIVSEIRYIVSSLGLAKTVLYFTDDDFLTRHGPLIKSLSRIQDIKEVEAGRGMNLTRTSHRCWLDVDRESAHHFREKLADRYAKQQKTVQALQARLANKDYVKRAPREIVEQTKQELAKSEELSKKIGQELENFQLASRDL